LSSIGDLRRVLDVLWAKRGLLARLEVGNWVLVPRRMYDADVAGPLDDPQPRNPRRRRRGGR
jgi:hypothetical protein